MQALYSPLAAGGRTSHFIELALKATHAIFHGLNTV
jgi:hypothetical protein